MTKAYLWVIAFDAFLPHHCANVESQLSRFHRLGYWVFLFAFGILAFWAMDKLTGVPATEVEESEVSEVSPLPKHPAKARMFIFFVDSLRTETATNPQIMPHLNALRGAAASARVNSSYDAVTTPAIRAAFTGKDRVKIFAFMANFVRGRDNVPSLFTQLKEAGIRSAVYSDGTFTQFGNDIQTFHSNTLGDGPDEIVNQNAALAAAFQDYQRGDHDLVVAHITYTDHVAHEGGLSGKRYIKTFAAVDRVIGMLAQSVAADENLVIFGDHGHTIEGRHGIAMDVPTFALFRGPGFCRGCDLGTISITDYRYLLGWGLKLPLAADYQAGRHPQALFGQGPLPPEYAKSVDAVEAAKSQSWGLVPANRTLYYGVLLLLGIFAALALTRFRPNPAPKWLAVAGAAPLLFALWGEFLAHIRPDIHYPSYVRVTTCWVVAFLAGLAIMKRWNKEVAVWVLFGLGLFFLYPTSYRYGWPAIMAPIAICWALFEVIHRLAKKDLQWSSILALGGAIFFLLPFSLVNAESFQFESWRGALNPTSITYVLILSLAAKVIVFGRPNLNSLGWVLAVACSLLLFGIQIEIIVLSSVLKLGLALACLVAAAVGTRGGVSEAMRPIFRILGIFGLWLLFQYLIRVSAQSYFWADCLLAAMALLSRAIPKDAPESTRRSHAVFLGVAGLIAAGWIQFSWGVSQLEWHFLYDFFESGFIEKQVVWFLPLVLIRYAVVYLLIVTVVGSELPLATLRAHKWVFGIAGAKMISMVALTMGLGVHHASSGVYLEGVQQCGVLLGVCLGLMAIRTPLRWVSRTETQ